MDRLWKKLGLNCIRRVGGLRQLMDMVSVRSQFCEDKELLLSMGYEIVAAVG